MSYLDHLYQLPMNEECNVLNEKTKEEWRALGMKLRGLENKMMDKSINFARRHKNLEQRSFYTPNGGQALLAQHRASRLHSVANNVFSHANGEAWRNRDLLK